MSALGAGASRGAGVSSQAGEVPRYHPDTLYTSHTQHCNIWVYKDMNLPK